MGCGMKTAKQFIRFWIVGGVNTAFSYSLYACFLFLGLPYPLANLLAFVVGVVFSFMTQSRLVFSCKKNGYFPRFLLAWVGVWIVNVCLIGLILKIDYDEYAAGAMALIPVTLLSFCVQKFFVFRPSF